MSEYTLYGYTLSYFTRKLEAALQWYGLPFRFATKTLAVKENLEMRSGTQQVPVLHTPENWMIADSTPIMQLLDTRYPARRMFPLGLEGLLVHLVEEWLDEWIGRTVVHYRWNYPECAQPAAATLAAESAPDSPAEVQATVAAMIADWGRRACRAVGVSEPQPQRAAEAEVEGMFTALDAQLATSRYSLGERPCAVDASLLGGLRAHFLNDPVSRRRVEGFPRVLAWMKSAPNWDGGGALAPFPNGTPFAQWILNELRGPYRTYLLGNAKALAEKQKFFVIPTAGVEVSYLARPYPERSRQMIQERVQHQLNTEERAQANAWLARLGLGDCFGRA